MSGKYSKLKNGESTRIDLDKNCLKFACCSCGHVHIFQFNNIKGNIWDFAISSDRRATGQLRRYKFGNLQNNYDMKKKDIYEVRTLFENILSNQRNDVGNLMRMDKMLVMINKGIEICNKYINKMKPLKTTKEL